MDNKIRININIAEKNYTIKIELEKEAMYRNAAKMLNEKLLRYRKTYKSNNDKEFLGMIAYGYLVKYLERDTDLTVEPLISRLQQIDENLTATIDNV